MTIVNNIAFPGINGVKAAASGSGSAGGAGAMFDLGGLSSGGTAGLGEKLAALLQSQPGLLQKLQQAAQTPADPLQALMQLLKGQDSISADLLKQINALLQQQQGNTQIQPTLTSDLTALSAQDIQDADLLKKAEELLAAMKDNNNADTTQLADALNALEPQAGVNATVMAELKQKLEDPAAHFTRNDALQLLKDKGLDAAAIQKYMAALDKPDLAPAVATEQQPVQPEQKSAPQPKNAQLPQHISTVNALAAEMNSGGQPQSDAQLLGQQSTSALALNAPASAAAPGFANYMTNATTAAAPVTQTVAVQLQVNAAQKIDTMTLQLTPIDLGRLDIKLKFEKDGGIKAHLSVDKPETLAMLRQDSTHLQRALQEAGFDTDDATLSFDLRQQGQQQDANGTQDNHRGNARAAYGAAAGGDFIPASISVQSHGYISQSGVNIMV